MMRIIMIVWLVLGSQFCFAEQDVAMTDSPTGVTITFNESGDDWNKIISKGEAELVFGDATDIRSATQKATLRAKSNIAKFLNERLKTSEVHDDMIKIMAENSTDGSAQASRKRVDTTIEKIENSAEEILKGVLVLEQDINKPQKQVFVTVGMSRKTQKAADSLRNSIKKDLDAGEGKDQRTQGTGESGNTDTGRVVKKSKNYDNF